MSENVPQAEAGKNLSQRAGEWKQILEEATDIVIDLITVVERARNLWLRATRRCCGEEAETAIET